MAKHQITINIVSKQSKDEAKREKLNAATGNSQSTSSSTKLQSKQSAKSGKSSSSSSKSDSGASAINKAAIAMTALKLPNTLASTAINLIGSVGDLTVEAARLQSAMNLGTKISSIVEKSVQGGSYWWAVLILELANWAVEMGANNIEWNHQQQLNTIETERSSQRLGIVTTAGNRNMKL